jgi:hypothetical protein
LLRILLPSRAGSGWETERRVFVPFDNLVSRDERKFLKFRDTFRRSGLSGPIKEAERLENGLRANGLEPREAPGPGTVRDTDDSYVYGGLFAVRNGRSVEDDRYYSSMAGDDDFNRFQSRLRRGKVKLCAGCGGVMSKSSRRVLSAPWGVALVILGAVLMTAYGMVTNFYQPPWYVRFALPAAYYIGSIFVGVGILFFFIREKVWNCHKCKEIEKR